MPLPKRTKPDLVTVFTRRGRSWQEHVMDRLVRNPDLDTLVSDLERDYHLAPEVLAYAKETINSFKPKAKPKKVEPVVVEDDHVDTPVDVPPKPEEDSEAILSEDEAEKSKPKTRKRRKPSTPKP